MEKSRALVWNQVSLHYPPTLNALLPLLWWLACSSGLQLLESLRGESFLQMYNSFSFLVFDKEVWLKVKLFLANILDVL